MIWPDICMIIPYIVLFQVEEIYLRFCDKFYYFSQYNYNSNSNNSVNIIIYDLAEYLDYIPADRYGSVHGGIS